MQEFSFQELTINWNCNFFSQVGGPGPFIAVFTESVMVAIKSIIYYFYFFVTECNRGDSFKKSSLFIV